MADFKCGKCGAQFEPKAKFCPGCGVKVFKGLGCGTLLVVSIIGFLVLMGAIGALSANDHPSSNVSSRHGQRPQVAAGATPLEIHLDAHLERDALGGVVVAGETNLPNGTKIGVDVRRGKKLEAQDWDIVVRNGRFASTGFTPGVSLYPAGPFAFEITSEFTDAWQSPDWLNRFGKEGRNFSGSVIVKEYPDTSDSPYVLRFAAKAEAPAPSPEAQAIALVRQARLVVPPHGLSATDIDENLKLFLGAPGVAPGSGWRARSTGPDTFEVAYNYLDGDERKPLDAIWTASLRDRKVAYVNMVARTFSWTPAK